jgi:nicotinamidase-related amidase
MRHEGGYHVERVEPRGYPEVRLKDWFKSRIPMIDKSLGPVEGDIIVSRPRVNAFYSSDLQSILSSREVHTLVIMGISAEWVVEATARHAADADYRVIVLEDCCASMSVEVHDFTIANILGRIVEVSNSEEFLTNLK